MEADAKILILEDREDSALKMETVFEDSGFEVVGTKGAVVKNNLVKAVQRTKG